MWKKLKGTTSFVNKKIAYYKSIEMKKTGSDRFKNTKMINSLRRFRNNYVNDYLHKASKNIIDKALEHKVEKIVIGEIKGIKQDMNYNKSFVQIPIRRLAEQIKYKVRGLFKSSFGLVNADVNGSLSILRKEEKCIPQIVQTMKDKGSVSSPLRVRVAC